ncbi:S-layer homology domain-containing protein [Candidatus Margulisiibacteriota bacterium]
MPNEVLKTSVFILLFSFLSFTASAQFLDVPLTSPIHDAIKLLADEGIVRVGADKIFNPNALINRYEMSVLIFRTLRKTLGKDIPPAEPQTMSRFFKDIPKGHYAYDSVSRLFKSGVVSKPYKSVFKGDSSVSRYEFYTAAAKMLKKTGKGLKASDPQKKDTFILTLMFCTGLIRL